MRSALLVGFRGAGKSTAAKAAAEEFGVPVVDLDACFEAEAGCSIPDFVAAHGEEEFRRRESGILVRALDEGLHAALLLVAGGGVVELPRNRDALKAWPHPKIWIPVSREEAWTRLQSEPDRLLVGDFSLRDRFDAAFLRREAFYRELATQRLESGSSRATAGKIFEIMKET